VKKIDLHAHTTHSDGSFSPGELVREAKRVGLSAVAVTDHDNCGGCAEAKAEGERLGIEVVPGIEISTRFGVAVHILGFYIQPDAKGTKDFLDWIVWDRDNRNRKMCALMAADGLDISYEKMKERFGTSIGRPHFAELLVEMGLASSINDAFDKYVEKGRKYYVARNIISLGKAVEIIKNANGVPVLAHPFQYRKNDKELRELIEFGIKHGMRGMECRYSGYSSEKEDYLEALAEEYGLVKTGGSDFHGDFKKHIALGRGTGAKELCVPAEWLERLKTEAGVR